MDVNRNTEIDTHPTPRRGTNPRASVGRARAPNGSACEKCRKKKIKVSTQVLALKVFLLMIARSVLGRDLHV